MKAKKIRNQGILSKEAFRTKAGAIVCALLLWVLQVSHADNYTTLWYALQDTACRAPLALGTDGWFYGATDGIDPKLIKFGQGGKVLNYFYPTGVRGRGGRVKTRNQGRQNLERRWEEAKKSR